MEEFELKFLSLFYYWLGKLGLRYIPCKKDNRYDCHACIDDDRMLIYNYKKLKKYKNRFFLLMNLIFHELGHIKNKLPYNTKDEKFISELKAEKFAIKNMKKYYPKEEIENEKYTHKLLRNKKWIKKNKLYYEVYKKIKEYK